MKISVIVPIYNVAMYLGKCLTSIINQTYKNLEIILVNDGSKDESLAICKEFKKKDDRIIVINKQNGGLSSARNAGLNICSGDLISFIDSDDFVDLDYFEKAVELFEQHSECDIVCFNYYNFDENKHAISPAFPFTFPETQVISKMDGLKLLLNDARINSHAWDKLYRRELWGKTRFPEGKNYEDIYVMDKVFSLSRNITICSFPKYYYVNRSSSISKTYSQKNLLDHFNGLFIRFNNPNYDDFKIEILKSFVHFYLKLGYSKLVIKDPLFRKNNKIILKSIKKNRKYFNINERYVAYYANHHYLTFKIFKKITDYIYYHFSFVKNAVKSNYFPHKKTKPNTIYFLGYPEYNNLGDIAIGVSTKKFLLDTFSNSYNIEVITENCFRNNWRTILSSVSKNDKVVIQGGGNFSNIYFDQQLMRKKILGNITEPRVINMPVSLIYSNIRTYIHDKRWSDKSNFHLVLREQYSYAMCDFQHKYLIPDIVFYLLKSFKARNVERKEKCLILLRNDKEKKLDDSYKFNLIQKLHEKDYKFDMFDTVFFDNISFEDSDMIVDCFLHLISSYRYVITDRLHGAILSYVASTECFLLDNSNHKIKGIYEWMKKSNNIHYVDSNFDIVSALTSQSNNIENKFDIFNGYFENLSKIIEGE